MCVCVCIYTYTFPSLYMHMYTHIYGKRESLAGTTKLYGDRGENLDSSNIGFNLLIEKVHF